MKPRMIRKATGESDRMQFIVALSNDITFTLFDILTGIMGSRHTHMRELRVQSRGTPLRIIYAFDPRRTAILPIGGDKTGKDRFYEEHVPLADDLYDIHLEELKAEGAI